MNPNDLSQHRLNIIKIWNSVYDGARQCVKDRGYTYIGNMPEVAGISGACESTELLFKLDFFGSQAYLVQSGQLPLELLTPHFKKVYCEIQSHRAESAVDKRHLTQFSLFEIELLGGLEDLLVEIEVIVKAMMKSVASDCRDELLFFGQSPYSLEKRLNKPFFRMTYTEAVEDLKPIFPILTWGDDMKAEHEKVLTDRYGPMFLTHFPKDLKFFNMLVNSDNPMVVDSADLLLPYSGESGGAAAREHEYDKIVKRLKESSMYKHLIELGGSDKDFEWYLSAHRNKVIPSHAGAGLGINRIVSYLLGLDDIRKASPFVSNRENLF